MMAAYAEPEFDIDFASEELTSLTAEQQEQQRRADPMNTGFMWYTPPLAAHQNESGGEQWIISGHDMQVLMMTVPTGRTVVTEVGSFFFGSAGTRTDVEFTCCSEGEGCKRICGGESCVKLLLTNDSPQSGYVGLTPGFPAKVIPLKFGTHINEDNVLIAQPGVYMAQLGEVDVGCDLDSGCATACCAGFGCCRQKISGTKDSVAFLAAGGTIMYRQLKDGETVTVDSRSVVAMEESVSLGITSNGQCSMMLCGGEGCCSTTLTGPGKVFMQSMSFKKFKAAVTQTIDDDERGGGGDQSGGVVGAVLSGVTAM